MSNAPWLPPCTADDWDDGRRRRRLRDTRAGHHWVRFGRLRRALARTAVAALPLVALFTQYWAWDVAPVRERLALTQPQLHPIHDAATREDRDTAVVDLVGLGNLDATETATALPALSELGQVWAVEYDNSGLDTAVVSRLIRERAAWSGIENIVLTGHSMGGIIALEVAQHLYQDTDLEVTGVILDCTPLDLHAVRADARDAGEDLLRWIGWLPGARESRSMRMLVEVVARMDRFVLPSDRWYRRIDTEELHDVAVEVLHDKIFSTDAASNGLIESQFRAIVASGAIDNLRALADERDDKIRPAIAFLRPRNAVNDNVVDVEYSHRILIDQSGGVDGTLLVSKLDRTGHANPIQAPAEYNTAITNRVVPFVDGRPGEVEDDEEESPDGAFFDDDRPGVRPIVDPDRIAPGGPRPVL
ncbi:MULTISPECIES: alpha/beta fold hydrolase [Rhodococcus]|uniref:alpha/beta fold hydrolase n=1 Tax=Rhodococcus TaxID=1827 RepID=UPI001E299FED|nr:alpha/beta fold hydrolase [Rhodococcus pyridinivorans]MCD2117846.1 alpha/beta hydrolase [Rhodococcus pyridinivorans]MCZ4626795.1 alpha/beta fold hydrolase [Rhodococcus pyridinivorans]MCZ4647927.1 alpha/beta fold hydrolase [Rhodococcus pyridinivorans]MDJ0483093.1 alpha/beta fold hydrolase [Rhodococcus pyridinivorans]MDV7254060.1 alpha/beta fold hydrolase [Rhodococcus pyridinivorans]